MSELAVRTQGSEELARIAEIAQRALGYRAGGWIRERAAKAAMIGLTGGTGAGKTTMIAQMLENLHILGLDDVEKMETWRSRRERLGELEAIQAGKGRQFGRFLNFSHPDVFRSVLGKISRGSLFQLTKVGEHAYGTDGSALHIPTRARPGIVNLTEYIRKEYEWLVEDDMVPGLRLLMAVVPSTTDALKANLARRGLPEDMVARYRENEYSVRRGLTDTRLDTVFLRNPVSPLGYCPAYDGNSKETPPAWVAGAAIIHGDYSDRHKQQSEEAAWQYLDYLEGALAKYPEPAEVEAVA